MFQILEILLLPLSHFSLAFISLQLARSFPYRFTLIIEFDCMLHIDFIPNPKALGEAVRRKNRLSIEKTHYYSIERRRGEGGRGKRKFKSKKVTEIVLNSQLPPFHPISNTHITRSHTSAHTPSHSSLKVKFIDESTEMLTRAQVGSC